LEEAYSVSSVKTLLENYVYIRSFITGVAPKTQTDASSVRRPRIVDERRQPLGQKPSDTSPWPFMEGKRASQSRDGKRRGRQIEDMHVSVLDLESGLNRLDEDDRTIVFAHYAAGYTFEELAAMYGLASRGSMNSRVNRIVRRLTDIMNGAAA